MLPVNSGMRFRIGEKTYDPASLEDVTLKDILVWQSDMRKLGLTATWADLEAGAQAMVDAGPDTTVEEISQQADFMLMISVTVWASRRAAGEDIGFADAIDIPMSQFEIILPEDTPSDPTQPAKKPAKKTTTRKGSGRAGAAARA